MRQKTYVRNWPLKRSINNTTYRHRDERRKGPPGPSWCRTVWRGTHIGPASEVGMTS
jgi:hypothetical protein